MRENDTIKIFDNLAIQKPAQNSFKIKHKKNISDSHLTIKENEFIKVIPSKK